jgi:hypothetical protein
MIRDGFFIFMFSKLFQKKSSTSQKSFPPPKQLRGAPKYEDPTQRGEIENYGMETTP